ncbi:hypothetical protein GQ53DRAFT_648376 [Thozetella sp. PMI_491]|nr:hypothetical protein GQ53DRAFT_648376 [Thozetella sp. PMI_491]
MKFGHQFEEALQHDAYPSYWVDSAVPYGKLKKILAKVRQELAGRGYDPATLRHLLESHEAEYRLDSAGTGRPLLRPRLTVQPCVQCRSARQIPGPRNHTDWDGSSYQDPMGSTRRNLDVSRAESADLLGWIEVPLAADRTFFDMVQTDVSKLDQLQHEEQRSMNADIASLGKEVAEVAQPTRFSRSDLYRWREIFELYLSAQVFFSTHEDSHGSRDSTRAHRQLVWFQAEVQKRELHGRFKLASSTNAYARFLALNAKVLQSLRFQELNQRALTKIIKKFDKKTSLSVKHALPVVLRSDSFMVESVAKALCAQLSRDVVSLVPQMEDYLCPVCFGICWVPVRLRCLHLFCIRCIVKMQSQSKTQCPLCRADTIVAADCDNLDPKLEAFMKRWFPKEVNEKQISNDIERGKELFGPSYEYHRCAVM